MKNSRTKHYDVDGSKILELLYPRLKEKGWKIKDRSATTIDINFSMSFWSYGERMTISVEYENTGCMIIVTTVSKYSIQKYDWGKSQRDIDKVFSIIDKIVMELKLAPDISPQFSITTNYDKTMFFGCPKCGNDTQLISGKQYCPVCKIYL